MHERPNLKAGASNNPILGGPDRYWDINAFELQPVNERGNLGRNTLIGPSLRNFDFSLVKSFDLGEQRLLQFRTEVFNLLESSQFRGSFRPHRLHECSGSGLPDMGTDHLYGNDLAPDLVRFETDVLSRVASHAALPQSER